jgi:hypothetical protein
MSTRQERGRIEDIVMREFATYAAALTAANHSWGSAWEADWPQGSELRRVQERFGLALDCARAVGLSLTPPHITQLHQARLTYVALFPGGAPNLSGDTAPNHRTEKDRQ